MSVFIRLRDDEGGFVFARLAALVVAPIILGTIAMAAITVGRTGTNITEAVYRQTAARSLMEDLRGSVGMASNVTVQPDGKLVVTIDPTAVPGGSGVTDLATMKATCVKSTFWFTASGGLATLNRKVDTYPTTACIGTPTSVATQLTGLKDDSTFAYANRAGRPLVGAAEPFTVGAGVQPAGVPTAEWNSAQIGRVILDATMQETFNDTKLTATAILPTPYL